MADRYTHLCADPVCCSFKQPTPTRSCLCHKTREEMMLARIAELENEAFAAQSIREQTIEECAAIKQSLEFAVITIAFIGRDRGTPRQDEMLDGIVVKAIELEKAIRSLAAAKPTKVKS